MEYSVALEVLKERLGIRSNRRDVSLYRIIEAVADELKNTNGINLNMDNATHFMFVVDYAMWRFQSRDSSGVMPRNLQFRLHNMILKSGGATDGNQT